MTARKVYLLQCETAGYLGNSPMFYGEGCNYTQWIDQAKRWTYREAKRQIRSTRGSHQWRLWPLDQIERCAKRTVDMQDLRTANQELR